MKSPGSRLLVPPVPSPGKLQGLSGKAEASFVGAQTGSQSGAREDPDPNPNRESGQVAPILWKVFAPWGILFLLI